MKPTILGQLEPNPSQLKFLESLKERPAGPLGEISPFRDGGDVFSSCLEDFALSHGFKFRDCHTFSSRDITDISGSVVCHVDEGYGLAVTWLLDVEPLEYTSLYDPEFVYEKGILPLPKWSVFVFDGDKLHGLISNNRIVIAQLTVKKCRKPRQ